MLLDPECFGLQLLQFDLQAVEAFGERDTNVDYFVLAQLDQAAREMLDHDRLHEVQVATRCGSSGGPSATLYLPLLADFNLAEIEQYRLDHTNERLSVRECPTTLEEIHLINEIIEKIKIARAEEVLHDACCRGGGSGLADRRDVVEAEIVELGNVELIELVGADEGAEVADLDGELLALAPLIFVCLFDFVLGLDE